jgi:hypothetical protein
MAEAAGRPRPLLAVGALGSGVALIVSLGTGAPLWTPLLAAVGAATLLVAFRWSHATSVDRARLARQMRTGVVAGLAATAAYDVSRWTLVLAGRMELSPFGAFPLFGELLVGDAPVQALTALGALYHLWNGTAFAVAYSFLLGGRDWRFGVLWGLGLEAAMLAVYPGWLPLDGVLEEFVTMSFLGHVAYGTVLGLVAQRRLAQ